MARLDFDVLLKIHRADVIRRMDHAVRCDFVIARNPEVCNCSAVESADRLIELDTQRLSEALILLHRLVDREDEPCRLDHHGYCQTHLLELECSVKAAREWLKDA